MTKQSFYILFFLLLASCLLPVQAQTLKETDLYLVRGDSKIFEFSAYGNITADELLFVVKKDTAVSSVRLIQKQNIVAGGSVDEIETSYRAPFTKIQIKFIPVDTEDLLRNKYKFDLTRTDPADSTDHTHLFVGNLNLQPAIATPGDGSNVPLDGTRFYFVGLDSTNKEPGIPIFRDSDNSMDYLSYGQLADSLDYYSVIAYSKTSPASSDSTILLRIPKGIIIDSVWAFTEGSTPSVPFNVKYGTSFTSMSGIFTSEQTADNTTTGETFTPDTDSISVNYLLGFYMGTVTGTVSKVLITIYYREQ